MDTGDKIKIFPDTDIFSYITMIHDMGFNCTAKRGYILIGKPRRMSFEDKREIGRKITSGMKEKNISREELAKELGVKNPYSIWNWQIGRTTPSEENREKLRKLGFEI